MRIVNLLALFLCLATVCDASESPKPASTKTNDGQFALWNGILPTDGSGLPDANATLKITTDRGRDEVCYKMRSYLVRRESPDSDMVRPVGYTTCLPATRVQMRTSELPLGPASR